ncbi:MAG: undecaprenyl-diphosphate phosphatase [Bacteroidaceae bacterium]|nr:undecaprenyl-diphosphate phosphatase [Bacteroidaceae bacterium]
MSELEALLLGLVQGLTEYLPVSSSGHLAIASHLFGLQDGEENLMFTVAVHVATVLSTIVILWREIWLIMKGMFVVRDGRMSAEMKYVLCILLSMIPVGIVGVCFKDVVEDVFGSGLLVVGICLLVTAALLSFSYYSKPRERQEITFRDAFIIGLAQAIAVLPGLSRSGSTIGTGLILGVSKERLAQFSFLMVIPPILGEALLDVLKVVKGEAVFGSVSTTALAAGFVAAFVSGCFACKVMIDLVKRGKMIWFAAYCALAGVLTIVFSL